MFPKKNHLTTSEFKKLFLSGRRRRGDFLNFIFQTESPEKFRFAVVVSKKKSKKTTVRNRARRRILAALREVIQESPQTFNISGIFILEMPVEDLFKLSFLDIKKEISSLLEKSL